MPLPMAVRQRTKGSLPRQRDHMQQRQEYAVSRWPFEIVHLGGFRVGDGMPPELAQAVAQADIGWKAVAQADIGWNPAEDSLQPSSPEVVSPKSTAAPGTRKATQSPGLSVRPAQGNAGWKRSHSEDNRISQADRRNDPVHRTQHAAHAGSLDDGARRPQEHASGMEYGRAAPPPTAPLPKIPNASRPFESLEAAVRRAARQDGLRQDAQEEPRLRTPKGGERVPSRAGSPAGSPARYNAAERLWLHRNYRGEAPFLAAWALSIQKEDDRTEGQWLLKELMRADEENLQDWYGERYDENTGRGRPEQNGPSLSARTYMDDQPSWRGEYTQ